MNNLKTISEEIQLDQEAVLVNSETRDQPAEYENVEECGKAEFKGSLIEVYTTDDQWITLLDAMDFVANISYRLECNSDYFTLGCVLLKFDSRKLSDLSSIIEIDWKTTLEKALETEASDSGHDGSVQLSLDFREKYYYPNFNV
ncbi:MAG: hypothetical protein HRT61_00945 [Ekhidna sp.]|nr:hypothetical protein [Ekhidna sp.]